jgi:Lactonase, 7-bladed beta-propeller
MSKKIGLVFTLVGTLALSSFFLSCGSSSSRPSGVVYALTAGTNGFGNNVSSFSMDLDSGNISLVNSNASTCPAAADESNPEPCGLPLDILLDPTGATAFVLNQGIPVPPSIYPYTVNSDGSLSAPGAGVFWTCISPIGTSCTSSNAYVDTAVEMVRDPAGQFLFVIDQGVFPQPTTCPMIATGAMTLADTTNFVGCPSISVFTMKPGSTTLTFVSQSPNYQSPLFLSKIPTALSPIPLPSDPTQDLLFATNNQDIFPNHHNDNTVSMYAVSSSGVLTERPNSPYAIVAGNPISVQAVNTNPPGQNTGGIFVYVGNQAANVGALNPFQVCTVVGNAGCNQQDVADNLMTPLVQSCSQPPCNPVAPTAVGQNPIAMVVDPTNSFLYALSSGSNQVWGFRIGTSAGTLTAQTTANQPTGAFPVSMALHPSVNNTGQFLYTSNSASANITGFTLSTTAGTMSSPITVIAPSTPSGIAVH